MIGNLCEDCFDNTAIYPEVMCKNAPYSEPIKRTSCADYKKIVPNEIHIFFGFGDRGNRIGEEYIWSPATRALSGLKRNGKRPNIASIIGRQLTNKEDAQAVLDFVIKMVQFGAKINMSPEVKGLIDGKV